jgi:cytochrome bd-type quinol oxidase subunit 1
MIAAVVHSNSMPMDVPLIGARATIWIVAQVHLDLAAFVLGAPIFIVICEWLGHRGGDPRYERLAKESMKVVAIAYSFTALLGGAFAILLMGPYHTLGTFLLQQMGAVFGIYVLLFLVETTLMYAYWYSWEALADRKGIHISIGVALNVVGTLVMFMMNAVGSYMMTPPKGTHTTLWQRVDNMTFWPLNLHRFVANITMGGFMIAFFAAFMFMTSKRREDREFYDWMGFIGNFIGVATLMILPLAGYIYSKEIFNYDASLATFQMADKLSTWFVMQGLFVSLLFIGANYYMWMSIRRIDGAERYLRWQGSVFAVILLGGLIWLIPQNFYADLTSPLAGVGVKDATLPPRSVFLGLMMAKALAVTAILIMTFLTYMIYRRAVRLGTVRWGAIAPQAQYALVFVPVIIVYTMGWMGAVRELTRQDWHVYLVLRDTTPYWYTPPLGYSSVMVGLTVLIFFSILGFIFWIGFKLGAEEQVEEEPERAAAGFPVTGKEQTA